MDEQLKEFAKVIGINADCCSNVELRRILQLSAILLKIITRREFEMKNFLPHLYQKEYYIYLNEEEKEVFFAEENQETLQLILGDVLRKYFSGKRKMTQRKIRKRKRANQYTLLYK